jgi:hypothetical protein
MMKNREPVRALPGSLRFCRGQPHCQQVKQKENKKGPQITRIFVPKFLLICENLRNLWTFLVPIFLTC